MTTIYNYLSIVLQRAKNESKHFLFELLVALVLLTLPLHYRYNSSAIIILAVFTILNFKKTNFTFQKTLALPILIYFLMVLSLFWSIDFSVSLKSLSKEIALLIIPMLFIIKPIQSKIKLQKIVRYFAYGMFVYTLFYLLKALIRYAITGDSSVFFYHELVTIDTNAIYISVYIAIAFFVLYTKHSKTKVDYLILLQLLITLLLLSSKNICVVFFILLIINLFLFNKTKLKSNYFFIALSVLLLTTFLFFNKIKDRFVIELESNAAPITLNKEAQQNGLVIYNVSISRAWNANRFEDFDYFTGTSLRAYQLRIFIELMNENKTWLTGFGSNATDIKIENKQQQYNLHKGYGTFNFHNQYIQIFAEIGVFGLLILFLMLGLNLKKALQNKDFLHFSFAVLMISLFLTESFLSRQRGLVFFVLMYCIFNSKTNHNNL